MQEKIMLLLIFFICQIFRALTDSPFPATITLTSQVDLQHFQLFQYESHKFILSDKGIQQFIESPEHIFTIENTNITQSTLSSISTSHVFRGINDARENVYVFPFISASHLSFQIPGATSVKKKIGYSNKIKARTSLSLVDNQNFIISYCPSNSVKGKIYYFNINTQERVNEELGEPMKEGIFDCQYSHKHNCTYCIYANSTSYILISQHNYNKFITFPPLYQMADSSIILTAIRFVEVNNNLFIGVARTSFNNYLNIFSINVTDIDLSLKNMIQTDVLCDDISRFFIYKVFDNLVMVIGATEEGDGQGYCSFYNNNLDKLSVDNKNLGGNLQFDSFISEDNIWYEFLYRKTDPNYLYYIRHEIMKCQDLNFAFSKNDSFFSLDFENLMLNTLEYPHSNNGIRFRKGESNEFGGTLIEIDNNGNELSNVIFDNNSHFYKKVLYHVLTPGSYVIKYTLIGIVTDDFYIPSQECQITINNKCYPLCESCSDFGSEDNQFCQTCISNYYLIEGTSNCASTPPLGYYYDYDNYIYRSCMDNCSKCQNQFLFCLLSRLFIIKYLYSKSK